MTDRVYRELSLARLDKLERKLDSLLNLAGIDPAGFDAPAADRLRPARGPEAIPIEMRPEADDTTDEGPDDEHAPHAAGGD